MSSPLSAEGEGDGDGDGDGALSRATLVSKCPHRHGTTRLSAHFPGERTDCPLSIGALPARL